MLCVLAGSPRALDGDGFCFDLLEGGIVVSRVKDQIKLGHITYLTRFSEAITLVDTALPRAWSSIVSWDSKYFLPRKT